MVAGGAAMPEVASSHTLIRMGPGKHMKVLRVLLSLLCTIHYRFCYSSAAFYHTRFSFMYHLLGCGAAPKLLAEDCFDLGTVAYQAGRYTQARDWLRLAETFIREGRHDGAVNRTEVLEYLAWIEYVVSSFISTFSL